VYNIAEAIFLPNIITLGEHLTNLLFMVHSVLSQPTVFVINQSTELGIYRQETGPVLTLEVTDGHWQWYG